MFDIPIIGLFLQNLYDLVISFIKDTQNVALLSTSFRCLIDSFWRLFISCKIFHSFFTIFIDQLKKLYRDSKSSNNLSYLLSPRLQNLSAPWSILPNISKIYERIMHNQMNDFFINKLSTYQCLRKRFGAQQCLLLIIEKLQEIEGNKKGICSSVYGPITAYSNFNSISHEPLIGKLNA